MVPNSYILIFFLGIGVGGMCVCVRLSVCLSVRREPNLVYTTTSKHFLKKITIMMLGGIEPSTSLQET